MHKFIQLASVSLFAAFFWGLQPCPTLGGTTSSRPVGTKLQRGTNMSGYFGRRVVNPLNLDSIRIRGVRARPFSRAGLYGPFLSKRIEGRVDLPTPQYSSANYPPPIVPPLPQQPQRDSGIRIPVQHTSFFEAPQPPRAQSPQRPRSDSVFGQFNSSFSSPGDTDVAGASDGNNILTPSDNGSVAAFTLSGGMRFQVSKVTFYCQTKLPVCSTPGFPVDDRAVYD